MTTAFRSRATDVLLAPLRRLERARGWRRRGLVFAYGAVAAAAMLWVYRASRLAGLPDVGHPFDPAPVLAIAIPDDRNAWVPWREAIARVEHSAPIEERLLREPWAWPKATDPEGLAYLGRNAGALDLWCRGAERPDALLVAPSRLTPDLVLPEIAEHRHLWRMAMVAASGRVAAGDPEGAWSYYRAILRASRLLGRNGFTLLGLVGTAELGGTAAAIRGWAADPGVKSALLRRALADALAADALGAPTSQALRMDYLSEDRAYDDPEALFDRFLRGEYEGGGDTRSADWMDHLLPLRRAVLFAGNEPTTARRLRRLAYANWLAHCDDPPASRPAYLTVPGRSWGVYDIPASRAPGGVSGRELARRIAASRLAAWWLLYCGPHRPSDRDRNARASVILALASALFERERGRPPHAPEELVGPYLDRLPEGYVPIPLDPSNP